MDLHTFRKKLAAECDFNPKDADAAFAHLKATGEYVRIFEDDAVLGHDPVDVLFDAIYLATGPTHQLLSGFRGASKTTTLIRLQERLTQKGFTAVRVDVEDYLSTSVAPSPVEFLLFIAVAFEEAIDRKFPLSPDKQGGIWRKVKEVMGRTSVKFDEVDAAVEQKIGPLTVTAKFKLLLKDDTFVRQLRDSSAGTLPAMTEAIKSGMRELVAHALTRAPQQDGAVVLLVDSVEHYRGNIQTAQDIQASIQTLFDVHANLLRFDIDALHVLYTVPPYLRELVPTVPALFGTPNVRVIPAVKIFTREGKRHEPGLRVMSEIARRRIARALVQAEGEPGTEQIISDTQLDRLAEASGGLPREMLRILHETNLQLRTLPVDDHLITRVLTQLVAGRGTVPMKTRSCSLRSRPNTQRRSRSSAIFPHWPACSSTAASSATRTTTTGMRCIR